MDDRSHSVEARPIFSRLPRLEEGAPWMSLAELPTPLEIREVDIGGARRRFRMKRDDLSGRVYGGNKVRKLEFLLGRARATGAGRVLTAGGEGSHHALATAVYAGRLGWPVTVVLSPQPDSPHARKVHGAIQASGAEIRWVDRGEELGPGLQEEADRRASDRPFVVPPGGSDAVGTLGYLNAALELARQLQDLGEGWPSSVYLPAGTLGTTAGLALGFRWLGVPTRIIGVRVVGRVVTNREVLENLLQGCADLVAKLGADVPPRWAEDASRLVELREGYLGRGYGHPTDDGEAAMRTLGETGLPLDPTYTAKAAAALLDDLAAHPGAEGDEDGEVLYWHTLSAVTPTSD